MSAKIGDGETARALRRNEGWAYGIALFSFFIWVVAMIFAVYVGWGVPSSWPPPEVPVITGNAVEVTIPLDSNGNGFLEHECCDCALTHHVVMVVSPEGDSVKMFWEVDLKETRKRRLMKGIFDSWGGGQGWMPPAGDRQYER